MFTWEHPFATMHLHTYTHIIINVIIWLWLLLSKLHVYLIMILLCLFLYCYVFFFWCCYVLIKLCKGDIVMNIGDKTHTIYTCRQLPSKQERAEAYLEKRT